MNPRIDRGSVVRVRFDPAEGREIRKTRPAVVVSNSVACQFDSVVQVVPVTRLPERRLRPYECRVDPGASGLKNPSRLVANQVCTVSRKRIEGVIGRIAAEEEVELDRALRIQLSL